MHVLQLLPTLTVGGVERGVLDIATGLIRQGHRVSVVSSGGPLVESLKELGAAHYDLPVHDKSLTRIWWCVPALERILTTAGVDIVHARSRVPAWIGYVAARRAQRAFLTTAHGFYAPHLGSRVMAWGRYVITPSHALGRYLLEQFKVPRDRLRVIPRGVDLEAFRFAAPADPHEGPWRIGIFGRLSRIKGHDVALRACARLIRRGVQVRLVVAGGPAQTPWRRRLGSLVRSLHLEEAVEWHGISQDVPAVLASVDCVIVPSTYPESFGRSVIEAYAVGRPVVASSLGGLTELVEDGRTGLLVRPNDPQALADAVERLVADPELRARCVQAGRRKVEAEWTVARMVDRTLEVYDECLTKPKVVVWKLSALGDVILSTPSLRAIRRHVPRGEITLVVGRAAYPVIARCPHVDGVMICDPTGKDRGVGGRLAFWRRLRAGRFDRSIDLQNSRFTHLAAWAAGIPVRVGYDRKLGRLLTSAVPLPPQVLGPVAHQHHLLDEAGIVPAGEHLEIWPSPLDEQRAEQLLQPGGGMFAEPGKPRQPIVGLHPGGSGRWKTKRWELARWARLCDALAARGIRVVVTGGPEERALAAEFAALASSSPLMLVGDVSLMELACLIKRFDAFVAHDSSPVHLAAAVGTPTIALFGPTDPRRHVPTTFSGRVIQKDVFCRPCYATRCWTITHACMRGISEEEVLEAVLALLPETGRPAPTPSSRTPRCASST